MKQIVCEMCESTQFAKEDGMFICQDCGMKYSLEEAKKLMVEVEGGASTAKSSSAGKIANMITLAQNAIEQSNNAEAESYANKILELDSSNAQAWLIKGQAVGWQSRLKNTRYSEMISCFVHALENVSDDQREEYKADIKITAENIAKAYLNLTAGNFAEYPSDDNVANIRSAVTSMLDLQLEMIKLRVGFDSDAIYDHYSAELNSAAVDASDKADKDFGPEKSDKFKYAWDRWLGECDNCLEVLELALNFAEKEARINAIIKNYRFIDEAIINSCSYKFEATGYWSGYVKDYSLTDGAKASRRKAIANFEAKGKKKIADNKEKARKKAEEERRAKFEKYWEEHAEEKEALLKEQADLEERVSALEAEIKEIRSKIAPEIAALLQSKKVELPEEKAVVDQKSLISQLSAERQSLGLFKGKQKKELDARITNEEYPKLSQLISLAQDARKAFEEGIDSKIKALEEQVKPKINELTKCKDRINQIKTELTKDR